MSKFQQEWQGWENKFIELTQREKIILFFAAVFLVGYGLYTLLVDNAFSNRDEIEQARKNAESQLFTTNTQIIDIENALKTDNNEQIKQQIVLLRQQLAHLDSRFGDVINEFVAPEKMATALTNLLIASADVRIIGMDVQPPGVLENELDEGLPSFFRHQLRLQIEGDYFALMQFVEGVSSMDSQFNIQNLSYKVIEHPKALMSLTLVTISDNKNVIRL